jgi:predicted kinase
VPTVYFLIGVQGAGKSTWARVNAERLGGVVLASDDVRNELEAQGTDATDKGDLVFGIVEQRLGQWLDEGKNVIVDATHARVRWREKEVAIGRERGAKVIGVWFDVPLDVCLMRNRKKEEARRPMGRSHRAPGNLARRGARLRETDARGV